ncbi:hypothetical protein E2I00_005826 [Balaenoptera physalus]|uniref:Uncharacterized protein n=1 Tax=Balaenoptera physalus TaxID=9770 RepID=A0A643C1V0_BALPH|nr:hypothetical protein E2I00_005826 [Balaenoptera physalus]
MSDVFLSRNILSLLTIRKLFTLLGLLLPALFSLCLLYLSSSFHGTMIFLILANATGSFCMGGILINVLDIAPRSTLGEGQSNEDMYPFDLLSSETLLKNACRYSDYLELYKDIKGLFDIEYTIPFEPYAL